MLTQSEEVETKILETIKEYDFNKLMEELDSINKNELADNLLNISNFIDELPGQMASRNDKLQKLIDIENLVHTELLERQSTNEDALKREVEELEAELARVDEELEKEKDQLELSKATYERVTEDRMAYLDGRKKGEQQQRLIYALLRAMPVDIDKLEKITNTSREAWDKIERVSYLLDHPVKPVEEQFPEIRNWRVERL